MMMMMMMTTTTTTTTTLTTMTMMVLVSTDCNAVETTNYRACLNMGVQLPAKNACSLSEKMMINHEILGYLYIMVYPHFWNHIGS